MSVVWEKLSNEIEKTGIVPNVNLPEKNDSEDIIPINLYYTQTIRGFQQESVKYNGSSVKYSLKWTRFQCNHCGSPDVTSEPRERRLVHGEPIRRCHEIIFEFTSFRLYCPDAKHELSIIFHSDLIPSQDNVRKIAHILREGTWKKGLFSDWL